MNFGNSHETEWVEESNPFMEPQGLPPDQIQYQQVMGQQQQDSAVPWMLSDTHTEPYPGPLTPPTEDEILDANFPVQIGLTHFPSLRAAVAGAAALVPPSPGIFAQVHGRNEVKWNSSMMDQYPYYDDGPRFDSIHRRESELKQQWETRAINARNQMGVISRPVPENMDSAREGEDEKQTKKRQDHARHEATHTDLKHKRRLDPTHPDFDAQYATLWHAQQAAIRQHNNIQRAVGLQTRRQFDIDNERPAAPDPQAPADQGDDLFDFSWHRRTPGASTMAATRQAQHFQQGSMEPNPRDPSPQGPGLGIPGATRCQMCKKHKKGCDLGQTGLPCTRCREKNHVCVEGDIPIIRPFTKRLRGRVSRTMENQMTPSRGQGASRVETVSMDAAPLEELMDGISSTWDPSLEIQARSPFLGQEEAVPRSRSAIPPRGVLLYGDKCDNCERYGRSCEDERPCLDCSYRNVVCNGTYLNNPYRSPRIDDGSDNSSYGIFRQAFRASDYGGTASLGAPFGTAVEGYTGDAESSESLAPFAALRRFNANNARSPDG